MLKIVVLFLWVLFSFGVWGASCGDDHTVKTKLQHLKMEVACAEASSVHSCQQLLNGFSPVLDHSSKDFPNQCEDKLVSVYPVSTTAHTLAKEVNDALKSKGPKHVNTLEEFVEHTRLHRERVKTLGLELFKSHPELFKGLHVEQVRGILEAHDMAKVSASSLGPDGKPFYRTLYEQGYGKRLDRSIVDALNAKDKQFMENALEKYRIKDSPDLRAKMEKIEKIADFVDRGLSPVSPEEFGRPMEKASSFMSVDEDKKLAAELEKKYQKVTEKSSYRGLTSVERRMVGQQLLLEERFVTSKGAADSAKLSARLLSHKLMINGSRSFVKFFELLGSKGASRALMALDFPMLYFADMDRIGCDGIGYHDWVKNPNCAPAIGLTPKVVKFLSEDWETQKFHLENENYTCKVIKETYAESITAPKVTSCRKNDIAMELPGGDRFQVSLNDKKQLKEIYMRDLAAHAPGVGKVETVSIGDDGKVSSYCYLSNMRGGPLKKCTTANDPANAKMNEFIKTINYQIQKGMACCLNSNPSLAKICPAN